MMTNNHTNADPKHPFLGIQDHRKNCIYVMAFTPGEYETNHSKLFSVDQFFSVAKGGLVGKPNFAIPFQLEIKSLYPNDDQADWFPISSLEEAEDIYFNRILSHDPVSLYGGFDDLPYVDDARVYKFGSEDIPEGFLDYPLQINEIIRSSNSIARRSRRGAGNMIVASAATYKNLLPAENRFTKRFYFKDQQNFAGYDYIGNINGIRFLVSKKVPFNHVFQFYKGIVETDGFFSPSGANMDAPAYLLRNRSPKQSYLCIPTFKSFNTIHYMHYFNVLRFRSNISQWLINNGISEDCTQWTADQRIKVKIMQNDEI